MITRYRNILVVCEKMAVVVNLTTNVALDKVSSLFLIAAFYIIVNYVNAEGIKMGVKVFTISQLTHDTYLLLQNEFRVHNKN